MLDELYLRWHVAAGSSHYYWMIDDIKVTGSNGLSTVDNGAKDKIIKIYPNPSNSYIRVSGLTQAEKYKIHTILGTEIIKGTISDNEKIDFSRYSNGLYFLKFENENTIKFMKE